ncbi:MAG: beta-ketoacyl-[acyl-carrier-protein] synthase family protein [Candidatus Omnitrophica bacterium]|nr:beta-ketoacyl-[acyl-carrier-protein] synthase family protein [Candidatus Omnitrophota bacterium]
MKSKRIVITGIGVLSGIGIGKDIYWQGLREGRSGIKDITVFDTSEFKIKVGGEITGFSPKEILGRAGLVDLDRATTLLSCAMKFALEDSGIDIDKSNRQRLGISAGTTFANFDSLFEFDKTCLIEGPACVNPSRFPNAVINSPASRAAIRFGIKGFNTTISSGACAGADAIDHAFHMLCFDRADQVLAGAVEAMSFRMFLEFYKSGSLSGLEAGQPAVSRPFDRDRDGMVLAEGAAVVLLETLESALNRKAKIYAEIASVASNFEPGCFHQSGDPTEGMVRAMESALKNSGLGEKDIDCIFASANSTKDADAFEAKAINQVFGAYSKKKAVSAIKSMIGETLGSSGPMNVAAALGGLERGFIPAIINFCSKDKDCDLKFIFQALENISLHHVMVNCFDTSGTNTVFILKQYD